MSSQPNVLALAKQIEEKIKAARPKHLIYNPSNEWVEIMVNGTPIQVPPDGKGKGPDGAIHTYDGTIAVSDVYGVDPEALKKARQQGIKRPDLPQNKIVLTALEAVSHAVRKRYARGICFLTGDPEEDRKAKVDARATWIEYRKDQAERSVNAYRLQTAAFHADPRNSGQPAPPMPEHVQAAQEFLDDYRLGLYQRKRFACPVNCGYYTDDESRLQTHIRASHPLKAGGDVPNPTPTAPTQTPPLTPPAEPAPEPESEPEPASPPEEEEGVEASPPRRGPGRPRKVPYNVP